MRQDMYKVIVERPRAWKGGHAQAARLRDDYDGPTHLGMRAGYGYRDLNENLAPLRRYLLSQVGRPWAKVFSEICAGIDRRNTVQQHIHQHIDDFIAIRVGIRDDELVDLSERGWFRPGFTGIRQQLFVDPRSGLIRVNKKYRDWRLRSSYAIRREQEQAELDARRRVLDERTVLLRLNDLWFEVKLAELPARREVVSIVHGRQRTKVIVESRYDVVLRRKTSRSVYEDERKRVYGSSALYAVSKRQLSKRELNAHGLRE